MKLRVAMAVTVGFSLHVIFGLAAVLLFSPRAGNFWINAVARVPYVLCPVLLLTDSSSKWWYVSPLTNAALYGVAAHAWIRARKSYAS